MEGWMWTIFLGMSLIIMAYQRASLIICTLIIGLILIFYTKFHGIDISTFFYGLLFILIFFPLNFFPWRRKYISQPIFDMYCKLMPKMSRTEREAISAGTITWEGDLFRGKPNWKKLLSLPTPLLSNEEKAFLEGPVETLCSMINDWEITHHLLDLPPPMWDYLKKEGFFGLTIPKEYGGKGFSAFAHSQVIVKISGCSITVSTTVAVPNSLGPAELLLHYGTKEQKNYYLPRLAIGEEIPCFALTSKEAGSDASAMTDIGIVCYQEYQGINTLGICLNWDKRYITMAPIATVIGLAFKLYDPDHLIGEEDEIGITCALIPRNTPGITIGRRHFPLNTPFQNGPISGKNVFIPIDWIIGGQQQAGNGWCMLMECLAGGRAITLPASTIGGAKVLVYASGAYARIRKQFHVPIGYFEGIEEPLARIGAYTYIMEAARYLAVGSINMGEKPSVASAIVKYHVTELGRKIACDSMDIHGGKGICLGPNNYIGRGYQSSPIAITVEGANILTRNLIIFGQGVIRCHPYILAELAAANLKDKSSGLHAFDKTLFKHIGFVISNVARTFVLALTSSYVVSAPKGQARRYFQHATRFSSALAFISDICMAAYGSNLKRKESISARLGDVLSYLYLLSAVLKRFHDQGKLIEDFPLVKYSSEYCLYKIQNRLQDVIKNLPNRFLSIFLKFIIFPFGARFGRPKDYLNRQIAQLLTNVTDTRQRLAEGVFLSSFDKNILANVQNALLKTIAAEPIEKIIESAKSTKQITGLTPLEYIQSALENKIISLEQFDLLIQADEARKKIIMVDDFATDELG